MNYDSGQRPDDSCLGLLRPPDGVLPGIVPLERILASSDRAAICLSRAGVYRTGLELEVLVVVKGDKTDLDPRIWNLAERDEPRGVRPTLMIQFADGLRLSSADDVWGNLAERASGMVLVWARGTERHLRQCLWIWPVPTSGPVIFSCEWQDADISESTWSLRGEVIADAANRAKADL